MTSAKTSAKTRAMTDAMTTRPSLTLKRHFMAPVARVFAAWTDPALIARWFGPHDDAQVIAEADAREGGAYRLELLEANGDRHCVSGLYREVVPGKRLVFTWAFQSTPERESLVTVEFAEKDGGTLLTLTHAQFADEDARDRHEHGWTGSFDRLARFLA